LPIVASDYKGTVVNTNNNQAYHVIEIIGDFATDVPSELLDAYDDIKFDKYIVGQDWLPYFDIKAYAAQGPENVIVELKDNEDSSFKTLVLKIKKAGLSLEPEQRYNIRFRVDGVISDLQLNIQPLQVNDVSDLVLDKIDSNPFLTLNTFGIYENDITVELYEDGMENNSNNNLFETADVINFERFNYSTPANITLEFALKAGVSLSLAKSYVIKVNYKEQSIMIPIDLIESYYPDYTGDGMVDSKDIDYMFKRHNMLSEEDEFEAIVDLNNDNVIDLFDYVLGARQIVTE